nr:anaerobic C4-dicarboxylate transporter family protein [Leminorella richardii]
MPQWEVNGKVSRLSIPHMIQMVMLATACFIMLFGKAKPGKAVSGLVFSSGMTGVISVFGISWLTGSFFQAYTPVFFEVFSELLQQMPFLFALVLFLISAVLFSQGATVTALMPLGLSIGISPAILVAMFPAVSGYFLIPAGASIIGCIAFDRTGTTKIGKYVVNHSYMLPGFVTTASSLVVGYFLAQIVF